MLKRFIFFLFISVALYTKAQQEPMYSLYMHDKMLINPAFVGSSNWAVGTLKYRTQFMGIAGNPITQTFNFHAPIQKKHIGLGLKIIRDKITITDNLNVTGTFSYHLGLAGGKLSMGLEGGILNQTMDFNSLIKKDNNDNSIPSIRQSITVPDINAGIYYQKKNFFLGVSAYHLTKSKLQYELDNGKSLARLYQHYFIYTGYAIDVSDKFVIEPNVLLKSVQAAPLQADINMNFIYQDKFSLGVNYRTGDAVCGILKFNITEQLRVAYAYDYTLSALSAHSKGAHEIMLSYGIKLLPPAAQKQIHPRYYF